MNMDYSKRTLQRLVTKEMKRFKMEDKHFIDNRISSQSSDNSVTADTEDVCENNSLSHDESPEGLEEYIERPEVQEDVFIGRERIHLEKFQDYHTSSDETSDNDEDDGSESSEMPSQIQDESGSFVRYMNDEDYFERSNDDASASSMEFSNNYVIKMNNELRGNVA
ncbi:hypothetical protein DAPPUDRAFT_337053, partial [Daphnia pulex]